MVFGGLFESVQKIFGDHDEDDEKTTGINGELSQGQTYLNVRQSQENNLSKTFPTIEGFANFEKTAADAKTAGEVADLKNVENAYHRDLSKYATVHKNLMEDTKSYLESSETANPYVGKNVQLANKQDGYVTEKGVFKPWQGTNMQDSAGKLGCPSGLTQIDNNYDGLLKFGTKIDGSVPLIGGTPMVSGQSCGNEGKNLYVNEAAPISDDTYEGCYNNNNAIPEQRDMGNVTFEQCKQRAQDVGKNLIGFQSKSDSNSGKCYVGSLSKLGSVQSKSGYNAGGNCPNAHPYPYTWEGNNVKNGYCCDVNTAGQTTCDNATVCENPPCSENPCSVWGCTCQGLADKYKVVGGVTFGSAPKVAQQWWINESCNTTYERPCDGLTKCSTQSDCSHLPQCGGHNNCVNVGKGGNRCICTTDQVSGEEPVAYKAAGAPVNACLPQLPINKRS